MIYIVSGFMRCGTSMMMKALAAGGMDASYNTARSKWLNEVFEADKHYAPNDEYFELTGDDLNSPDFPAIYDGKLIKVLFGGLLALPASFEYRIIFMRRELREIRISCEAAFDSVPPILGDPRFPQLLERTIGIMRDRRSVKSLDVVWYDSVLADPSAILRGINWPIDIDKAAAIPQPSRKRFAA